MMDADPEINAAISVRFVKYQDNQQRALITLGLTIAGIKSETWDTIIGNPESTALEESEL